MPNPLERRKLCEAVSCMTVILAPQLMCDIHWLMVPKDLRLLIADAIADIRRGDAAANRKFRRLKETAIKTIAEQERSLLR